MRLLWPQGLFPGDMKLGYHHQARVPFLAALTWTAVLIGGPSRVPIVWRPAKQRCPLASLFQRFPMDRGREC